VIAFCWVAAAAAQPSPRTEPPSSLFPVRNVWTLALNNQLAAPPAYDATHVFFSIAFDRIVAYELETGTQKWIVSAQPQLGLAAGDGLLIFVEPDGLTALRADDGSVAWRLPLAEKLAQRPVWDNGRLVLATMGGAIHALGALDGHIFWSADVGSRANALPALAADRVYVPTVDGRLIALRVDDGTVEWERKLGGAPHEIRALDERVYVGASDDFLYCLIAKDGRVDWRWRTGGDAVGAPASDERRVYFVALDNVLRGMNQTSGSQQWMRPLPLRPVAGVVMAGSTLVVAGQAPALRGYNTSDGAAAGEVPVTGEVAAPPYAFVNPATRLPSLLYVTRDLAKGATATLITRSLDPATAQIAPLPNAIMPPPLGISTR
jgi:outer membrane protein assembly factor BamB